MKSITIHGTDEPLEKLIKSTAKAVGLNVNKAIKKSLAKWGRATCGNMGVPVAPLVARPFGSAEQACHEPKVFLAV